VTMAILTVAPDRRLGALGQCANDCREHAQIIWFCARSAGSP